MENVLTWYWNSTPNWSLYDIAKKVDCSAQTVLDFLTDNNIPRRDYKEAGKVMLQCPHKRVTPKKYPLLTYENVFHWYWEEDPPWSMEDIAEKVGCTGGNVSRFMKYNNIPRRDHKDAAKNIFKCPTKKKNYRLTKEQRQKLSLTMKDRMGDRISNRQRIILQELLKNKSMFISVKKSQLNVLYEIYFSFILGLLIFNLELI
ncbi:hypothetical protein ES705_18043 [subsurface metagenome]